MKDLSIFFLVASILVSGCRPRSVNKSNEENNMTNDSTTQYSYNRDFLKKYTKIIELKRDNAALVLVPAWQGRVMTSTAGGDSGFSFGWINHVLISSGKTVPHINPYGGEERLWLGPEGGQYSIFFTAGKEFIYDNWQTPAFIDTKAYDVADASDTSALFTTDVKIINYSNTEFSLNIKRKVILLTNQDLLSLTGINASGLSSVAYRSENTVTNTGSEKWIKEKGLLSVWMLGMYNPSPGVVIVIPVKEGDENKLGVMVNDNYFGSISPDRLKVIDHTIFFRADGKSRGKIGIPPLRTTGVMGSFDSRNNILTLLFCSLPEGVTDYVNSAWEIQDNPYSGDAFNSYNDGPLEDGSQMGPFYELETSSPAMALSPGRSLTHSQVTVHLTGDRKLLDSVCASTLGVSLDEIENVFN
jgi:hypothetical protein